MKVSELVALLYQVLSAEGDMDVVFYTESEKNAKEYHTFNIDICEDSDDEDKLDCVICC